MVEQLAKNNNWILTVMIGIYCFITSCLIYRFGLKNNQLKKELLRTEIKTLKLEIKLGQITLDSLKTH